MSHLVGRLRSSALLALVLTAASLAWASGAWALSPGQPDPSFGSNGFAALGSDTRLLATAVQSDGKIVAVGDAGFHAGTVRLLVARFTTSGALDPSFSGGQVTGPANVIGRAVAIQPLDGKIVVAGPATDSTGGSINGITVLRFTSSGAPDGSFGSGGKATALAGDHFGTANAIALQGDGKIVVAGGGSIPSGANQGYQGVGLARFNANGSADGGFASGGAVVADFGRFSVANGVAIQGDGKIVIGGSQRQDLQTTSVLAGRFNSNGTVDGSFGAGGRFLQQYASGAGYSAANALALQPDGKAVLGGTAFDSSVGINTLIVRLTTGGSPDGSFGSGGAVKLQASDSSNTHTQNPPYGASGLVVSAGKIFAAGYYDTFGLRRLALWGLTGGGALDPGFGTGGRTIVQSSSNTQANALAVIPGGNLAVAGESDAVLSAPIGIVGRYGGPAVAIPPPPNQTPAISHLRISPGSFPAASSGGTIAAKRKPKPKPRKTGTTVSYSDSLAAVTRFSVIGSKAGIKSGRSCVARPRRVHGHPRSCTFFYVVGSFSHGDRAGANSFHFTGRIGRRALSPGSYKLQAVPQFARHTGHAVTVGFRIVR